MHSGPWAEPGGGAQVARAATYLMHGQVEAGSLCPSTMTAASIPVLRQEAWFGGIAPLLYSRRYDGRDLPLAAKTSMTIGMGMTEKQGGSDLRSNTTRAVPVDAGGRGQPYRLTGHKWFFSVPTADAHLMLARAHEAFSCFYVPRWLEDGTRNNIRVQRLKNKLGNRSNSSGEVEFQDALGVLVGEEGRGIRTLVEMASYTRIDCVLGSAALLRQALVQALHHARCRRAFGKALESQPLMRSVLADLALESEAATALALRLARALDAAGDPDEDAWRRVMGPAAKFWVCKRAIAAIAECMEVWGGNGFIEDGPMPRLYREAPVNSIWEGSGNIMCLDVLRALGRDRTFSGALLGGLEKEAAADARLAGRVAALRGALADEEAAQAGARGVARDLVLLVQAGLLRRHAPPFVADAFIASRFGPMGGVTGTFAHSAGIAQALIERSWPQ
jgi:putative acyl-CoA dehydrogenase